MSVPSHSAFTSSFEDFPEQWPTSGALLEPILDHSPLPPKELDFARRAGFEFGALIGRGAFGAVWESTCRAPGLEGEFACKVLSLRDYKKEGTNVRQAAQNMMRECNLVHKINHPNIVRVFHAFKIPDPSTGFPLIRVLMFMELCDGDITDLMQSSPDGRLIEPQAQGVIVQVCAGLRFLHRQGIIHFDIKPANILYKEDQDTDEILFKLTDFGLAKRFSAPDFLVGSGLGTDPYKDPVLSTPGERSDARKCDIFSLGTTLAELLVGDDFLRCRDQMWPRMGDTNQYKSPNQLRTLVTQVSKRWKISIEAVNLIRRMTHRDDWQSRLTLEQVIADRWLAGQ